jgi:hypothetical protein
MATGGWSASGLPPAGPVTKPKASLRVGQRVRKLGTASQLGTIRFVGEVDGRPGVWVGVEWDEIGVGDTNGELNGRRYFTCSQRGQRVGNAASFVRESELFFGGASPPRGCDAVLRVAGLARVTGVFSVDAARAHALDC